ncbi:hypothetical protein B0H14DRAFT_2606951 [Mycena olivaceomarginata]|nr:hypothetical protein B0H14DRAFT_2606951 [Mycena olivaceomarginata]
MDCQIREGETLPPIHRAVIKYIKKLRLRPFLNAAISCGSVVLLAVPGKGLATAGLFGFDLVGDAVADGVGLGTVLKAISEARMNREKSVRSAIHAWRTAADDHIPRFARSLGIQSLKLSRGEGDSADPRTEAAVVAAVIAAAASAAAASAAAAAAAAVAAEARACTTSAATTAGNLAAHRIVNPAGGEDGENNIPCTSAVRRTASMDTTERRATKATNDSSSVAVEALLAVVGLLTFILASHLVPLPRVRFPSRYSCRYGKGKETPLPPDQIEYLESVYPEWLEKRPHLRSFWAEVERGWFAKWPVEPKLGLPIASTSIEESELSEADQKRIGDAEEVMRGVIHNWINNRGQKEKKAIATNNPTAATSVPLRDLRNREELRDALEEEDYALLMGVSDDEETPEERKERIKQGQSRQMTLKRAVTQRLYDESPEEEKAAVEQIYLAQERKTKKSGKKAETPEEFQMGLDQLGSVLKQFHTAVTEMTGLVGGTVLVGPIPKEGSKIGTQSYCHGATAAGHTLDQAHPRWGKQVVNPLQQFGKKVFDHKTRRERGLQLPETSEEVVPAGG